MNKYMIGVDLDGTLLTSEKEITDRTYRAIEEAVRKSNVIVPVTGRPLSGIPQSILECEEIEYIITSNGAVTYNLKENRIVEHKCLSHAACNLIYNSLYSAASVFEVFVEGVAYEEERSFQNILKRYNRSNYMDYILKSRKTVKRIDDFLESGKVDEISVMFDETDAVRCAMQELMRTESFQTVETVRNEFEMYDMAAGKGNALINISKILGFSKKEIVAIGDSNNDLDMMEKAGFSIAMGNALDNVKKVADMVTLSNDRDGVAEAIEKFII